jgi:Zn finger protein HypA/HybF involved in hydrogenase expression
MHEAGLARAIAATLRGQGILDSTLPVTLVVRDRVGDVVDFDAALRIHLAVVAPSLDQARIEIVHAPVSYLCARCGSPFVASGDEPACPACEGPGIPSSATSGVELRWQEPRMGLPADSSRPADDRTRAVPMADRAQG